jgi:CHASE3 domain sensor protein
MHPSSLRLLWPLIFGFAVLLLAVAATALVSTAQQNASLAVRDLLQTENRLNRVMAMAIDAETGQRGYLLTGRDSYLAVSYC